MRLLSTFFILLGVAGSNSTQEIHIDDGIQTRVELNERQQNADDDNVALQSNDTDSPINDTILAITTEQNVTITANESYTCGNWSIWNNKENPRMITAEELASNNGTGKGKRMWIAMMSEIFDVTSAPHFYAKGNSYNIFVGRDANVPFITGNFTEEEAALPITSLDNIDLWLLETFLIDTYKSGDKWKYPFMGLLIGHLYKEDGEPTDLNCNLRKTILETAIIKKAEAEENDRLRIEREAEIEEREKRHEKLRQEEREKSIEGLKQIPMQLLNKFISGIQKLVKNIVAFIFFLPKQIRKAVGSKEKNIEL